MPAIITDQIRVLNASNFVSGISTTTSSYYVFIGLPNATEVNSDWNTNTPAPIDNFDDHDDIYDTLISAKKVNSSDVLQVIRKISWNENKFGVLPVHSCNNCGMVFQNPRFKSTS